jgi:hypothetical protein
VVGAVEAGRVTVTEEVGEVGAETGTRTGSLPGCELPPVLGVPGELELGVRGESLAGRSLGRQLPLSRRSHEPPVVRR